MQGLQLGVKTRHTFLSNESDLPAGTRMKKVPGKLLCGNGGGSRSQCCAPCMYSGG